jgi:hypothetical protein
VSEGRRLEDIFVFIVDLDGDEGIAAYAHVNPRTHQRELLPMVASTEEKLEQLTAIAQDMVGLDPSKPIRIVRFHEREDIAQVELPEPEQPA